MAKVGYRLPGCNFALFSSFSIFMVIITEASNTHRIKNKTTHISEHTCKQYTASKPRCMTIPKKVSQKPAHVLFIIFTRQQIHYCMFKCTCQVKPQVFDLQSKSGIRSLRVLTCSLFLSFFLFLLLFLLFFFLFLLFLSFPFLF